MKFIHNLSLIQNTITIVLVCFLTFYGYSQTQLPNKNGYWIAYTGDNKVSQRFGLHTEVQMRNLFNSESVETQLYRLGVNYYFKPTTMFTLGYGFIFNEPNEEYLMASPTHEHRIWQQLLLRQKSKNLFLEHRYRLEQRFIENKDSGVDREEHRLRYRFQAIFPLYSLNPVLRHLFLIGNNEVMINFRSDPNLIFDRNRLFVGAGYQVSPKLNFQMGYLNQFAQFSGRDKAFSENLLLIGMSYNMDDLMPEIFRAKKVDTTQN
ncbi:MAG: DUF2490 domain-containing protein [Flavobacterium sp.]